MVKVSVAGLQIDAAAKSEVLESIRGRLDRGERTFIITPYSEFLYAALRRPQLLSVFNRADISVADGIAILWAAKFLSLPLTTQSFYGKIIQALWQMKWTLAAIIFYPRAVRSVIPEKITGAELFFDLAKLATDTNQSIFLLGGFGDTPQRVAKVLTGRFPGLRIAGTSNKNPDDPSVVSDIIAAHADFLFVAYGPIRQEQWILGHWNDLPVKLAIGLGGTFDYVAGARHAPPAFIRSAGLEWLFRLVTQPGRVARIFNSTFGLMKALLRYKVFSSYPYRQNAVCVILNRHNKILICRRKPGNPVDRLVGETSLNKFANYWQIPQGGINQGEDIRAGALRESAEETGLKDLQIMFHSQQINTYEYNQANRRLWFNKRRNKGQSQTVVYVRHNGPDDAVKIDNVEFMDYQWVDSSQLQGIVHLERLPLIEIILKDLENIDLN